MSWKDHRYLLLDLGAILAFLVLGCIVLFLLLGCTMTVEQQEAMIARLTAAQGCYCKAERCKSVTSASGKGAQAMAGAGRQTRVLMESDRQVRQR